MFDAVNTSHEESCHQKRDAQQRRATIHAHADEKTRSDRRGSRRRSGVEHVGQRGRETERVSVHRVEQRARYQRRTKMTGEDHRDR